jgi:hypothetical protein
MSLKPLTGRAARGRKTALVLSASAVGAMVVLPLVASSGTGVQNTSEPAHMAPALNMRIGGTRTQEPAVTTTPPETPVTEKAVPRVKAPHG